MMRTKKVSTLPEWSCIRRPTCPWRGKAIEGAVHTLGFGGVSDVRVGRMIEFDIAGTDRTAVEAEVKTLCDRLLANMVIESYRVELI